MSIYWKNSICVASGNNADKGAHKNINLKDETQIVEFVVGSGERILNLNIWPNFVDKMDIYLVSPSNEKTSVLSNDINEIENNIKGTKINGFFYDIEPYSLKRRVSFELKSNSEILSGTWKIIFDPIEIVVGNIDIYLPTSEGLSSDTRFLNPTKNLTVTVPGSAKNVITVGSFNSKSGNVSIFSGEGDFKTGVYKPDLLAPGEDIISYLPGGNVGALTGTSMATPHVTGVCSLFLEWGVVNKNDPFLYSQKLKALILDYCKREKNINYPNNTYGYGKLDLFDILEQDFISNSGNSDNGFYRNDTNLITRGVVINHDENFFEEFEKLDINTEIIKISNNRTVIILDETNYDIIPILLNLKSVINSTALIPMNLLSEISMGTTNGVTENERLGINYIKNNPNIDINGRGVLIAVIDTGIDYLHRDFIYSDDTTKIKFLWDQTKDGNPPEGYFIGTEYSSEDINKAISENDTSLSVDEVGSGTMISGICCGLGNVNPLYEGVAKDSELIVVKLKKINGKYNNATLNSGLEYAYKKGRELNMPLCVNVSLGSSGLVGFDNEKSYKPTYFENGFFISAGAGDDVNRRFHTSGDIPFLGEEKEVIIELEEDTTEVEIQVWVDRPYKMDISIESPSGEVGKRLVSSSFNQVSGLFDFEQTRYLTSYVFPTTYSGQQFSSIILKDVKKGIWKIKLTGIYKSNGKYNMYIVNPKTNNIKFRDSDPNYTINYTAVSPYINSVGVYNSINNSVWSNSSRGPNIKGIRRPDLIAPGVNIIAPYPDNKYAKITGSAVANAYVVGASALFTGYALVDGNYKDKSYPQKIRSYMKEGCQRETIINYPNNLYGYGVLDIKGMFDALK